MVNSPKGLKARGKAFWASCHKVFEFTDSEEALLLEVCRTLDNLDALAASISKDGATVEGSAGQVVVNPALTEARGQRVVLHRLIAALQLPDEDGVSVPTSASLKTSVAANARWHGGTGPRRVS